MANDKVFGESGGTDWVAVGYLQEMTQGWFHLSGYDN